MSAKTRAVNQRGRILVLGGTALMLGIMAGTFGFALTCPLTKAVVHPLDSGVDLSAVLAPVIIAALGVELYRALYPFLCGFSGGTQRTLKIRNTEKIQELANPG